MDLFILNLIDEATNTYYPQLSVLSRQVGDLQTDNLKLYEKIRFLQVTPEDKTKHHHNHNQILNPVENSFLRPVEGVAGEVKLWFQWRTGMTHFFVLSCHFTS